MSGVCGNFGDGTAHGGAGAAFLLANRRRDPREGNPAEGGHGGDRQSAERYRSLVASHRQTLRDCRQNSWLRTQGIWMRLYPCDLRVGQLEQVFDNVASMGYNRVYVNAFYNGQVLLPAADNPTLWPSVVGQRAPDGDLLARAIALGRERGVEVHAWLFTMNFGPTYAVRRDRQGAFARNGFGQTNLEDPTSATTEAQPGHIFIDPYSSQAREDFAAVVRRSPAANLMASSSITFAIPSATRA
ncbi:MAG: hypothetical protein HC919_09690 [Oscillatoriales cyanobacterium SM2_2_1]|nr:hypothetical protein [Oscillatoriales cyanobacterium SM2_2_1]